MIGLEIGKEDRAVLGVLDAVSAVSAALIDKGYKVTRLSLAPPLESVKEKLKILKTDLVFNIFEGFFDYPQSEAEVAYFLEQCHFRFTGCRSDVLSLALDKAKSKEILAANGINVPKFQVLNPDNLQDINLNFPCIVKPRCQDASHGITKNSVVRDFEALKRQVKKINENFEYKEGRNFLI